jgi:hypothetical protein
MRTRKRMQKMTEQENKRIASYLRDYAIYLQAKGEKEYSAIVRLMIQGAVADIDTLVKKLED